MFIYNSFSYLTGLLERLNITVAPLPKDLVFICASCRTVFANYTAAKNVFQKKENEALKLLTDPVTANEEGQMPFVPYLKRKFLHRSNSEVPLLPPSKFQRVDGRSKDSITLSSANDSKCVGQGNSSNSIGPSSQEQCKVIPVNKGQLLVHKARLVLKDTKGIQNVKNGQTRKTECGNKSAVS